MSTEVYLQSIRKLDCCPFERVFLGGGHLKHKLKHDELSFEASVMGCHVCNIGNLNKAREFINTYKEMIDASGGYTDALDNYNLDFPDDFTFWILVEE